MQKSSLNIISSSSLSLGLMFSGNLTQINGETYSFQLAKCQLLKLMLLHNVSHVVVSTQCLVITLSSTKVIRNSLHVLRKLETSLNVNIPHVSVLWGLHSVRVALLFKHTNCQSATESKYRVTYWVL